MKKISFSLFNVVTVGLILLLMGVIIIPFNLVNLEQAQRIAKWIKLYEKIEYSFDLYRLHEKRAFEERTEADEEYEVLPIQEVLVPYLDIIEDSKVLKHKYRWNNGRSIDRLSQFYLTDFRQTKDGCYIGIKEYIHPFVSKGEPLYVLFVDINGKQRPNRVGQDIFFINVYQDKIMAVGEGQKHAKLKANCSTIGSGIYCSEYYLHAGSL